MLPSCSVQWLEGLLALVPTHGELHLMSCTPLFHANFDLLVSGAKCILFGFKSCFTFICFQAVHSSWAVIFFSPASLIYLSVVLCDYLADQ